MKGRNCRKRVIWAIDPFISERKLQASTAYALRALTQNTEAEIEPVFILNEYPLGVPPEPTIQVVQRTQEAGQEELTRLLTPVKLKNLLPLKVLSEPPTGQRGAADALIAYAKESQADLIILGTHAKRGLRRWFMGSLAETLMLHSEVPLFIVNPSWKPVPKFQHILFPTDFSDASHVALERIIGLAELLGADITIFHQLSFVNPNIRDGFSTYPIYRDALSAGLQAAKARADRLADEVRSHGLVARTYIDYERGGSTADAILHFSSHKRCLIAMAARSGPIEASLLGSTARKVVRGSKAPVWIIHPKHEEPAKEEPMIVSPEAERTGGPAMALL